MMSCINISILVFSLFSLLFHVQGRLATVLEEKKHLEIQLQKVNDKVNNQLNDRVYLLEINVRLDTLHRGNYFFLGCLLDFFKINFFKKFFLEHYQRASSLDPDQS